MNREQALLKNTLIITVGKICTQLISFFLLPLYTAILSTSEYGVVDLMNTIVSLLLPVVTLQTEQAVFRELVNERGNLGRSKRIVSTGIYTFVAQCTAFILLFLFLSPLVHNEYKLFIFLNVLSNACVAFLLQIARGFGDNRRYAVGSFISAISTIGFNILFLVIAQFGAKGMLLATFCGQLTAFLYLLLSMRLYRYLSPEVFDHTLMKWLWKYSIPLIPNCISWWIIDASDRLIVTSVLGVDYNGVLAAALKFASLLSSANYVLTLSWTESALVSRKDSDFPDYFNQMADNIFLLFVSLVVGMIACIPYVFPWLINEQYVSGYGLIPISLLATLANVVVGLVSVIYVGEKNTKAIAKTSAMAAMINIACHLCLIHFIGLYAAVVSSLVAFSVMAVYRIADIRKKYMRIAFKKKTLVLSAAAIAAVCAAYYINNVYINALALVGAVAFAFFANKPSIGNLVGIVKRKLH